MLVDLIVAAFCQDFVSRKMCDSRPMWSRHKSINQFGGFLTSASEYNKLRELTANENDREPAIIINTPKNAFFLF